MKITEQQIKRAIQEELGKVLFVNPSSERGIYQDFVNEEYERINLDEGLYKTYPAETTIRYIKNLFNIDDKLIRSNNKNGTLPEEKRIQVIYWDGYGNGEKMKKAMMLCGYTLSKRLNHDKGYVEEIYIPINLPNLNDIVRKYDFITHVTPLYNKSNILSKGFVPKSKNTMFSYPDRVFFFKGDTPFKEILYQCIDFDSKLTNKRNNHSYTIFVIDTKKIPNNVNFHTDLTCPCGIYTNDNLTPKCIKSYQDFNVEELKKKFFPNF